jgi:hypothetical protein
MPLREDKSKSDELERGEERECSKKNSEIGKNRKSE